MTHHLGSSAYVSSNQQQISPKLADLVHKYQHQTYHKPLRAFSHEIFRMVDKLVVNSNKPIILDSGCGTGHSCIRLAQLYPAMLVIGIDRSVHRLARYLKPIAKPVYHHDNIILVHADLIDFWRLIYQAQWQIYKHYLLYPNPWPKLKHIKRRWYAHPVFHDMVHLCQNIELRTNWEIYAREFQWALSYYGVTMAITKTMGTITKEQPDLAISLFERKYQLSGHQLFKLVSINQN